VADLRFRIASLLLAPAMAGAMAELLKRCAPAVGIALSELVKFGDVD
jgi:hypothetical protein